MMLLEQMCQARLLASFCDVSKSYVNVSEGRCGDVCYFPDCWVQIFCDFEKIVLEYTDEGQCSKS